ncbi:MAG: hypothetical protein IPN34_15555 [Planctomycetes bacterium]|nr:hypothetical protein [Planctomycetota bacterium]
MLCTSISDLLANEEIMALDHLPSGALLVTVSSGIVSANPKLLAVDPWTLALTPFARPSQSDINGGCYSLRRGRALLLDDTTNQLRSFAPGEVGPGMHVVCDVPLGDGGTGFSPVESLWEIDTNGPACSGSTLGYGNGLAGSGGLVPTLAIAGCPEVGAPFVIAGSQMLGGTLAALLIGPAPAAIPLLGGELCLFPVDFAFALPCDGAFGVPGAGSFALPMFAADPLLLELSIYLQVASVDPAAPEGIALSAGLRVILG